jgi:PEP-CTERM motif
MESHMNRISNLAFAAIALLTTVSAHADTYTATFSGLVQTQINSGAAVNSPISGQFVFDTTKPGFTGFTIGGQSIAAGFASQADLTPNGYTALYEAILSPVAVGGDVNSTFSVSLEGLAQWSTTNALGLLTSAQLSTNLDTANSSFSYYMANSNGTNIKSLTASLTAIQVTAVPEPSSVALLLAGVAVVVGAAARRRTQA